jgi:hypothetical protein
MALAPVSGRLIMATGVRAVVALCVWMLLPNSSVAQEFAPEPKAEVTALYNGLNLPPVPDARKTTFTYVYTQRDQWLKTIGRGVVGGKNNSPGVGILDWIVPAEEFGTAGMDRQFRTYCAEAPVPAIAGMTYKFEVMSPTVPQAYQQEDNEAGKADAYRRSQYIRELFGRYYVVSLTDARAAKAFQISLWEIVHESPWPVDQPAPLDLNKGAFTAAKQQDDPESVALANQYLGTLTGNDNVFYENPDLAGRELVWMRGMVSPLAGNAVAQSQFALQYVKGGGVGAGIAPLIVGGGLGGLGGGFGGLGGIGGGLLAGGGGGAGAFVGGSGAGLGSSSSPPTQPPITTVPPTTTTTVPPVNSPPTGPPENTTPVPAPAGIVLGLLAVGALVGRRALVRPATLR